MQLIHFRFVTSLSPAWPLKMALKKMSTVVFLFYFPVQGHSFKENRQTTNQVNNFYDSWDQQVPSQADTPRLYGKLWIGAEWLHISYQWE